MGEKKVRTEAPLCTWPSGWQDKIRHGATDNIILNESGTHILLAWRAGEEIEGDKWALIGGYVGQGKGVAETVHEETRQEADRQVGSLALFRIVDNPNRRNDPSQNISFVFASTVPDQESYGEVAVSDPDRGITKAVWFPRDDLPPEESFAFDHHEILQAYLADPTVYPLSIFMSGPEQLST